ncbi:MAG: HAMP domain-containing histidine kinase [Prevotella sp.]|nr:HAMP domain-containing histidine kinase [Prevotella sp.]
MKRISTILIFLTWCIVMYANHTESKGLAKAALAEIDGQIAHWQRLGDIEKEGLARWKKIVTLKNSSMTKELADEAEIQMTWFYGQSQWDNYYRTWQLKANALCSMGKLQSALHETQRMLDDAKKRENTLGRAMAYKQIGVIYLNMKQTEPAVDALLRYAELMKDEDDDISSLSNIYYRMAKAYDYDKAYDQELRVTEEWLEFLHKKVGKLEKPEVHECYNAYYLARAAAFIGQKKLEDAKMALDTAGHHAHLVKTSLSLHHYYKMQARFFLASGDAANAVLYTDSVSMMTKDKDDHTSEVRAQALMMLGRGDEAARIYQRLYNEKDSLFGRDARQHLDELNTLFQVDELKMEQQQSKFLYMVIAASSIMVALLLLLLYGWRTAIGHKKVSEELRIANEKAKASSKMKTEFVRNISHEIRTPLNILSGFTQILTTPGIDLPESEKADIQERVEENTDRITKLVDRMLELSDISSEAIIERSDKTDVKMIMEQAIVQSGISQHTLPENADSKVKFEIISNQPTDSVALITNELYAIRALSQILENAVKFTYEGSITLKTEYTENHLRFIVEDTGIGISADQADHVFEEFVQLDDFADGTGIGLTVARSIAQRMGGDLWLDTKYTQGSRFIFELLRK